MRDHAHDGPKLEVEGRKFETYIDNSGEFYTYLEGESITSPTFEGLRTKLVKMLRRETVRIAVPVTRILDENSNAKLIDGELTGMHRANGNPLFKAVTGGTEQLTYYGGNNIMVRLTETQHEEFYRLRDELRDATSAMSKFKQKHGRNPKTLITEAWGELADKKEAKSNA